MKITKTYLKDLVYRVNGAAIEVHRALGPGLLESVYHRCMKEELTIRKIPFISEKKVPINYKRVEILTDLRCDLLVDQTLVVELKAVELMHPVFEAQVLTYMRLLDIPMGLLINFNVTHIFKEGQKTYVNDSYRYLPH